MIKFILLLVFLEENKMDERFLHLVAESERSCSVGKYIIENYNEEVKKFKQVCPKEMLSKLSNPISLETKILKAN